MIATGPFANILSERAALLAEVAGAVTMEEPDDGLGLEEELEVKVAGGEPVEVPEVTEIVVGGGIEELLNTVEDVPEADVIEAVAVEVGSGDSVMGPGPRDILLCARTLPAITAKMKKAWGTEKRIA